MTSSVQKYTAVLTDEHRLTTCVEDNVEDRVVANLSEDKNKLSVFTDGIDGHSLAAVFYFPDEVKELVGDISDTSKAAVKLKQLVDDGCKKAKGVRDRSKPVSFGLGNAGLSYSNVRVIKKSNSVKPKSF